MVEVEKLFFYEAVLQQLLDDGLEDAAEAIRCRMKVKPNSMLCKNHLYNIFKNCAYISTRTVSEAVLGETQNCDSRNTSRLNEILDECASPQSQSEYIYKIMAYNNFAEFSNFKPCRCVAQSSDRYLLAIGGLSGSLHVTPLVGTDDQICKRKPNPLCTSRVNGHQEQVNGVDFHPIRNVLVSGGVDCNIVVHEINVSNGFVHSIAELQRINDGFQIRCLKFHPCGDFLFAGTSNSIIRLYDIATCECYTSRKTFNQHRGGGINSCDVNASGTLLFTAGSDGDVLFWDAKNMELIYAAERIHGGGPVVSVKCDPYNRYILSSGCDGTTKLTDLRMQKELLSVSSQRKNVIRTFSDFLCNTRYFATFSALADGKRDNSEVLVYAIESASVEADLTKVVGRAPVWDAIASKDEMSIITVSEDCSCKIISFYDPSL